MKFCSRSTLGIVIAILNLIPYIISLIICVTFFVGSHVSENHNVQQQLKIDIIFLIAILICLIMILITALLITGIVKRRHNLMLPWLILTAIEFVIKCAYSFIVPIIAGGQIGSILHFLFISLLVISLSGFILWAIYNLYKEIREDNVDNVMNPAYNKS